MAPNLSVAKRTLINNMLASNSSTGSEIAEVTGCAERTIKRHRANRRCFGTTSAPANRGGRRARITPVILDALCEHLLEKPDEDSDDIVVFLWDEFNTLVSRWTVSRALASGNWTAKTIRCIASGRNADLRVYYEYTVSEILWYRRVYVDESGCDKRVGFPRRGWSPRGVTPTKVTQFYRGQRY